MGTLLFGCKGGQFYTVGNCFLFHMYRELMGTLLFGCKGQLRTVGNCFFFPYEWGTIGYFALRLQRRSVPHSEELFPFPTFMGHC